MKGYLLPAGRQTFKTSDPALAQAYAPIVLPPGKAPPAEQSFDERGALDQALYDLLAGWARDDIGSGDPGRLERGLGYVERAERLGGVSQVQRQDLAALRGRVRLLRGPAAPRARGGGAPGRGREARGGGTLAVVARDGRTAARPRRRDGAGRGDERPPGERRPPRAGAPTRTHLCPCPRRRRRRGPDDTAGTLRHRALATGLGVRPRESQAPSACRRPAGGADGSRCTIGAPWPPFTRGTARASCSRGTAS